MADQVQFQVLPSVSQLTSRRVSFRKSIAEATLPDEWLNALEQKRRQLDESIHKYIASKEREYKNFEKDLYARHKASGASEPQTTHHPQTISNSEDSIHAKLQPEVSQTSSASRRRTSSESTTHSFVDLADGSTIDDLGLTGVQALLATGTHARRESDAIEDGPVAVEPRAAIARLTNRRASLERDVGLMGLFTPNYLTAIDDKQLRHVMSRTASAPAISLPSVNELGVQGIGTGPTRALSDTVVQTVDSAKTKRPSQLQVTSRTSSSGSSADGRLASALKSPAQKDRPKRKRVSLAVGDTIVAPSDNVPLSQSSTSLTPSHSRVRASSLEHERTGSAFSSPLFQTSAVSPSPTSPLAIDPRTGTDSELAPLNDPSAEPRVQIASVEDVSAQTVVPSESDAPAKSTSNSVIDPDGDFFDLEEDDNGDLVPVPTMSAVDDIDFDQEYKETTGIGGRVTGEDLREVTAQRSDSLRGTTSEYDPIAGLVPVPEDGDDQAAATEADPVQLELRPGSATSSQQPIKPGFRRPSVHADPIFVGSLAEYANAESKAVEEDVYGSSYIRANANGSSFRGGSLGESFMERNAADLMRLRAAGGVRTTAKATGDLAS